MTDLAHSKPARLAHAALSAALADKWATATRAIQRINDECGGDGLSIALRAWCDTYVDHSTDGTMNPNVGGVNLIRTETGQLDRIGSDRVPARVQWAARLVHARAAMDQEAWLSCIAELPDDGHVIGSYVGAVLEAVAISINGLPRGYAGMGRGAS